MEFGDDIDAGWLIEAEQPSYRLRFAPALERRFEAEVADDRCRRLITQNWIGLAIYLAFTIGDFILIRDVFWVSVALHLCIMTPIMIGVNATLATRPPVWLREGLLASGIVLAVMAILGLMLASHSPLRTSEHISVVLVILFATMVQRIRFGYVVAACAVSAILYVAALSQLTEGAPWERKAVAGAVFCGVVLFSIIGCWNLEREQRSNFLLRLRDRYRNRELEALSRRDPLTGVGNRLALEEALARALPSASSHHPTAVLLFDCDHFKSFNDDNGHLAGDACLRRVAEIITANVNGGSVYRFGGEEFLVLLGGAALGEAREVAERVRRAVADASIKRVRTSEDRVMTLSAGVAAAPLSETEAIRGLVADADLALYAAKHGGRDRVCVASDALGTSQRAA